MTDTPAPAGAAPDPLAILRSKNFIAVLVLAAVIGVVVSFVSWAFLEIVHYTQQWLFTDLPDDFGWDSDSVVVVPARARCRRPAGGVRDRPPAGIGRARAGPRPADGRHPAEHRRRAWCWPRGRASASGSSSAPRRP